MVVRRAVFIQSLIVVVSVLFNIQGNVVVSMKLIVYFNTCIIFLNFRKRPLNEINKTRQQPLTRNTCIAEPREARGGGGGEEAQKMSGMEGGENWSKLGSLGARVSTLALILEGEICS